MSEFKRVCVIDCGETIERYRHRYQGVSDTDMQAVLVAAATSATDGVTVDPILDMDSALPVHVASVMACALKSKVREQMSETISALMRRAGDNQVVSTDCRLEGHLIIVNMDLCDEVE